LGRISASQDTTTPTFRHAKAETLPLDSRPLDWVPISLRNRPALFGRPTFPRSFGEQYFLHRSALNLAQFVAALSERGSHLSHFWGAVDAFCGHLTQRGPPLSPAQGRRQTKR